MIVLKPNADTGSRILVAVGAARAVREHVHVAVLVRDKARFVHFLRNHIKMQSNSREFAIIVISTQFIVKFNLLLRVFLRDIFQTCLEDRANSGSASTDAIFLFLLACTGNWFVSLIVENVLFETDGVKLIWLIAARDLLPSGKSLFGKIRDLNKIILNNIIPHAIIYSHDSDFI